MRSHINKKGTQRLRQARAYTMAHKMEALVMTCMLCAMSIVAVCLSLANAQAAQVGTRITLGGGLANETAYNEATSKNGVPWAREAWTVTKPAAYKDYDVICGSPTRGYNPGPVPGGNGDKEVTIRYIWQPGHGYPDGSGTGWGGIDASAADRKKIAIAYYYLYHNNVASLKPSNDDLADLATMSDVIGGAKTDNGLYGAWWHFYIGYILYGKTGTNANYTSARNAKIKAWETKVTNYYDSHDADKEVDKSVELILAWNGHDSNSNLGEDQGSQIIILAKYNPEGKLKLNKSGESGLNASYYDLSGAEYTVKQGNTTVGKFVTDSNGVGHVDSATGGTEMTLPAGSYTVTETKAPSKGYRIDTNWSENVTIASGGISTVSTSDVPVRARVRVIKQTVDGQTVPLPNFQFDIRSGDSTNVVGKATTGSDGTAIFKKPGTNEDAYLELGTYNIVETAVTGSFLLNTKPVTVTLTEESQGSGNGVIDGYEANHDDIVPVGVKNKQFAYIKVIKTNTETGEEVHQEGIKFAVHEGGNTSGTIISRGTTDQNGVVIMKDTAENDYYKFEVPGTYTLEETYTPDPWIVTQKTFTITLAPNGTTGDAKNTTPTDPAHANGHTEPNVSAIANVIDNYVDNAPQYGRTTLTKVDSEFKDHAQKGGKFKIILAPGEQEITYSGQGDEDKQKNRNSSCGYPTTRITHLTPGSSTYEPSTGAVNVTNPIEFVDENGTLYTVLETKEDGTIDMPWLPISQTGSSKYQLIEVGTSDGHLIDGTPIEFTLTLNPNPPKYNESTHNSGTGTSSPSTVKQEEEPNWFTIYKLAADAEDPTDVDPDPNNATDTVGKGTNAITIGDTTGTPIQGATIGFWKKGDNLEVPLHSKKDAFALRVSDDSFQVALNQRIDGAEINGAGIKEGYLVHLVMEGRDDIVIDVEHDEIEHAPIGTYTVTLKNSEGRDVAYTGPSTIETKEGSAVNVSVTQSALTGKMLLETTVGEIPDRQAPLSYDSATKTWTTSDLKPHSTYDLEIGRKTVKVIETSQDGGKTWFGRYSETDSQWFADHYLDQAALPKKDSDYITQASVSGHTYQHNLVTDENGMVEIKRISFGEYVLAEVKPAVDLLTHKSWLVDTTPHHFVINEQGVEFPTGYIKDLDKEGDTYERSKTFSVVDDWTKLKVSKQEITGGPEIPGAQLTITSKENDVVAEWISTDQPHYITNLQPGVYTLIERLNPKEYEKANSIRFKLLPSGEVQHTEMLDTPITINAKIDKQQEIARPLDERYEANPDENNAEAQLNENGAYAYSLNFKNDSNTWTDEFTVTDPMEPATDGLAYLESLVTPQAFQDYDGKMNVWYKTNKTPADYIETKGGVTQTPSASDDKESEEPETPNTDDTPGTTGNGTTGTTGNDTTGNDTVPTPTAKDTEPVLKPVTGKTVTIDENDSTTLAGCSFYVNGTSVGAIQPTVGEYELHFATPKGVRTSTVPRVVGYESADGWSHTSDSETYTTLATTRKCTVTIKTPNGSYTYVVNYVSDGEDLPEPGADATERRILPTGANATITDGHENPWLWDKDAMAKDTDGDKRIIDFKGWKLWKEGVNAAVAEKLNVSDLGLDADEHITGVRFEYGRVEVGFTTRPNGWDRELLKDPHDDLDQIGGTNPQAFVDAANAVPSAMQRANILAERFTTDASKELELSVAAALRKADEDYAKQVLTIDEYNAKLSEYAEGTLPKFAEAREIPAYVDSDDDTEKLATTIESARHSILAAFYLGTPHEGVTVSTPAQYALARATLLEASRDVADDVRQLISPETMALLDQAIADYSTAMDQVPVAEGGEGLDIATQGLTTALGKVLDEIHMSGLSNRVPYAPAIMRMRLTGKYVYGATLRNSADVDAYRNGGNDNEGDKLEGHDHDEVVQSPRIKDIHIGTRLATRAGEKVVTSDGSQAIKMIDTVDYHGLTPGHEYVIDGDLHIRKSEHGEVVDGGAINGSHGSKRFVPTSPDGTVDVELTLPAGQVTSTVAFEELRVIIPETGKVSDYTLADHKNIRDDNQTVRVTAPAADLVKTGANVVALVSGVALVGTALLGTAQAYRMRRDA